MRVLDLTEQKNIYIVAIHITRFGDAWVIGKPAIRRNTKTKFGKIKPKTTFSAGFLYGQESFMAKNRIKS